MLDDGDPVHTVHQNTGWSIRDIRTFAREHGRLGTPAPAEPQPSASPQDDRDQATAPAAEPGVTATPASTSQPEPIAAPVDDPQEGRADHDPAGVATTDAMLQDTTPEDSILEAGRRVADAENVEVLLVAAEASSDARLKGIAARIRELAVELADGIAQAQARAEALAEVDRLRAALTAAEQRAQRLGATVTASTAKASTAAKTTTKAQRRFWPGTDYNPAEVRAWAATAGLLDQCPKKGPYLPDDLVALYLAR
jgi:hypothetical protein